ncbi:hypothetical protein OG555_10695 [Kribbella sp. NBC_01484]|uniref:hypothetical protein n=1 Tax=Kribbella sp. NBC_01484 TaxID=2903579 RepID=UPI002E335677|nr:hypothetical protein [Kribbella sp. NBC_01484]
MAGRGTVGALLVSGLVGVIAIGGAGGYGVGLLTTAERSDAASGVAAPLGSLQPSTPSPTVGTTPTPPPKKIVPDNSEPLNADDLYYKTRQFAATSVVRSEVSLRVPGNWNFTQPDPPKIGRYTDPTGKRWLRIEAGFTIRRSPADSMAAKLVDLGTVPANQMLSIKSQTVDPDTHDATLVYTYVPDNSVRYVVVRWVANGDGLCTFEIAVTGLPQDQAALEDVLQHAADSAARDDSPITPR